MKYNALSKKDIALFAVSYHLFNQILNRYEPSEKAYAPGPFFANRRHTGCTHCDHLWLTSEDSQAMWAIFKEAFESGEFSGIYANISKERDALILVARLRGTKKGYCLLGEWAIVGTDGPNPAKREANLKLRNISEAKLGIVVAAVVGVVSVIGVAKVHFAFGCLAFAAFVSVIFLGMVWRRDRRELNEI